MKKRMIGALLCALPALAAWPDAARADRAAHADSLPQVNTDWSDTLSLPLFDPSLGTLYQVDVEFEATLDTLVMFESFDFAPATITSTIDATVHLTRPDASSLIVLSPTYTRDDAVSAFDGQLDFGGTSGETYALGGDIGDRLVLTDPVDLALFTGTGTIALPVSASATAMAGGAGGLAALFSTSASAGGEVTYHYTPIPAPSAALLGGVGAMLVGWVRRKFA